MKNLASIQRILSLSPIDGADKIEKAEVLGWSVVVKKGEFKVGDLCCYIQIDTVVPDIPQFDFLRDRSFRVKTIKLRKQISQGLIISISDLPQIKNLVCCEGDDVTELVGVKKYSKDPEIIDDLPKMPKSLYKRLLYKFKYKYLYKVFPELRKPLKAKFPTHLIPITDEERIQNMPKVLEEYKNRLFIVSEKLDGSSITLINKPRRFRKSQIRVCSRRYELFDKKNEWYKVMQSTGFARHIKSLAKHYKTENIIVQGEYIGKPQGNYYKLENNEIRLFNIFVNGIRVKQPEFYNVCLLLDIPTCPHIANMVLTENLSELLEFAQGSSRLNENVEREGVVMRDLHNTISFKVISNKYLLKEK